MRERFRSLVAVARLAYRQDPRRAAVAVVLTIATFVSPAVIAYGIKLLVEAVERDDDARARVALGALVAAIVVSQALGFAAFVLRMNLRERTTHHLEAALARLASSTPGVEHYERPEFLDRLRLVRDNVGALAGVLESTITTAGAVIRVGAAVGLLLSVHPALALALVAGLPSFAATVLADRRLERMEDERAEPQRLAFLLGWQARAAGPAKEIRVFGLRDEMLERLARARHDVDRTINAAYRYGAVAASIATLAFAGAFLAAILFVANAGASAGELAMTIVVVAQFTGQLAAVGESFTALAGVGRAAVRYSWLVDYADAARSRMRPPSPRPVPDVLTDGIRLDGVSFTYPGTDAPVLRDVDLFLARGTTVAVVGENGAGKSTLVKLLTRLYDPTAGTITIDGIDLRELDVEEWQASISGAFQDFVKPELIAREVVGIGDVPRIGSDDAVNGALERAGGTDVVQGLANGLDSQLGASFEGGTELSGGQWQKLALGRALMRDEPLLLVLDEPTSSLDAATEHALFQRYSDVGRAAASRAGTVTVLVSHRFSTVPMADVIVVVDGGTVVEVGSHRELMERKGVYAELFELQARAYR